MRKKRMNLRLVSADAVKAIICKYEKRSIQRNMIFEVERLNGCIATQEQMIKILGEETVILED